MKKILILLGALSLVFSATACENNGERTEQVEQAELEPQPENRLSES